MTPRLVPKNMHAKKLLGRVLFEAGERLPFTRPFLSRYGMRTSPAWFENRIGRVHLSGGRCMKLASISENYLSFELFWRGVDYYEPVTSLLARELAPANGTFIDVGANVGFYTMLLALNQPKMRVIAFEPNPKNFRLLRSNVQLNRLDQVTCEPMALSHETGTATLYLSESDMSASLESHFEHSREVIQVPRTTLDAYLGPSFNGPLLIKVDVEGHEDAFFKGAVGTLLTHKPDLITEVTHHLDNAVLAALRNAGYRFYQITEIGLLRSDQLRLVIRGRLVFLNYLLSARPEADVARLFERIRPQVQKLDLYKSSKCVAPDLLAAMIAREQETTARTTGLAA